MAVSPGGRSNRWLNFRATTCCYMMLQVACTDITVVEKVAIASPCSERALVADVFKFLCAVSSQLSLYDRLQI